MLDSPTAKARAEALAGVSFEVGAGQTVAIVGRSGAGKTTCAYLMMRFWDPTRGGIALGRNGLDQFVLTTCAGKSR